MRILITGGFGYIGGRLGQHLQKLGHQVILGSSTKDIAPNWLPDVKVVKTNWTDNQALKEICNQVDVVIHAAGMNAKDCAEDPIAALEINGLATARMVNAAMLAGVKKFIYLSTAHVYASPLVGVITENTCPRNIHPYATSHLAGENVVLNANQQRGKIECLVLRLSNAFGAPVNVDANCWMLLANDLCRQALVTQRLVLQSSGTQQRDFIAMSEVCRVIEYLSSHPTDVLSTKVINTGSGVSKSVLQMAQLIQQRCIVLFGFEPEIQRPNPINNEAYEPLDYRTDRLSEVGFNVSVDNVVEVDELLNFCQLAFGKMRGEDT